MYQEGATAASFEAQRVRHVTMAIPMVSVSSLVAAGLGQQRAQPQQPNIPYRNVVDHYLGQPPNRRFGLADISVGFPG